MDRVIALWGRKVGVLVTLLFLGACVTGKSPQQYRDSLPDPKASLLDFGLPLRGPSVRVVSLFGWRDRRKVHEGLDFKASIGTPVYAAERGVVSYVGRSLSGYGLIVVINHGGGWSSVYAHLSRALVKRGSRVSKGGQIAYSGNTGRSTGPHLHFEIRKGADPLDPLVFLPTGDLQLP